MHELYLKKTAERRLSRGHPWVYSNEIDVERSPLKGLTPGIEVAVLTASGNRLGSGYASPGSLVSVRLLARGSQGLAGLIEARIAKALIFRERTYTEPYYRLVFAEGDGLPGLVVDRYGDELVVQLSTWGMEIRRAEIVRTLESLLAPSAVHFDDSSTVRKLEGLAGPAADTARPSMARENGIDFTLPDSAQKTGSSAPALEAASATAQQQGCVIETLQSKVEEFLASAVGAKRRWDLVVLDPPALIKRKKDINKGTTKYRALTRQALQLVEPGGMLVSCSCSMHLDPIAHLAMVRAAARGEHRQLRVVAEGGLPADHPTHAQLPESRYLNLSCWYFLVD